MDLSYLVNCLESNSCMFCNEYLDTIKYDLKVSTAFSEKTLFQIIEKMLDINLPEYVEDNGAICSMCYIKINEYDELTTRAIIIQNDFLALFENQEKLNISQQQEEVEEIIYTEYDEKMVEVIPEIQVKPDQSNNDIQSKEVKNELITTVEGIKHFGCEICGKLFKVRSRLKAHLATHSDERKFVCLQCGVKFKTLNSLRNHTRLHSDIFFYCDLCDKKFRSKHLLKSHFEAVHLKERNHICKICGKAFSRDKTLRQHLVYHSNKRNFECEICGFKTINRPKMNRHLTSHTERRDHACHICGKRFRYSYNVKAHINYVHQNLKRPVTDEKKLTCNFCGKLFRKIWKMKQHMEIDHKIIEEPN